MSKILRYAKFAEESSFDLEGGLPSPQFTIDIASTTVDVPSDTQLMWEGGIGRGPRTHAPGFYSLDGNVEQAADVHTIGWWLKWVLGGYLFDLAGGSEIPGSDPAANFNLHEMWGGTDLELPTFTSWFGKDIFEQIVRGCMCNQLQLQVSDGFLTLTPSLLGAKDETGTLDEEVLGQLPLVPPLTFPNLQLWVGGTDAADERSAKITDLTLTINNNGDASAARGLGSRFPQRTIPADQRETSVQFTTYYDSIEHIQRVWGGPSGPTEGGTSELPLQLVASSGADGLVTIELPRVIFTEVQTQPSGRSRVEQQVSATALLDTVTVSDAQEVESEIHATVENVHEELSAA